MPTGNRLYYGDNLQVLREHVEPASVDLVYLDPPFNSNRSYNVLFKSQAGVEAQAQIEAFDDTWHWTQQTEELYASIIAGGAPIKVSEAVEAMHSLVGPNDVLAYLVMMSARLIELHKTLKSTGALYLHCDPTASHYLKIILDAIFGPQNFRSEIIWKRSHAHSGGNRFGPIHDTILFYAASEQHQCVPVRLPYSDEYVSQFFRFADPDGRQYRSTILTGSGTRNGDSGLPWREVNPTDSGRHWAVPGYLRSLFEEPIPTTVQQALDRLDEMGRILWPKKEQGVPSLKQYIDDMEGVEAQDIWSDIPPIGARAAERLGYPTQKPIALLERIIQSSSQVGDTVLDPFCGCGTAVDAAQNLGRKWIGIDITYLAIDLIRKRLQHSYGPDFENQYSVRGIPTDTQGATALFEENPFDFERWAVSLVNGEPNQKQVGDKGIDGRIRFQSGRSEYGTVIVSVKGGTHINPAMVRDLVGTVERQKAEMGLLITLAKPTRGMTDEADHSGTYSNEFTGNSFPKVQIISVEDLMGGKRPNMLTPIIPYIKASPRPVAADPLF